MKKTLSIILAVILTLSVLPMTVFAEETDLAEAGATIASGVAGTGITYSVDTRAGVTDYQLTISGNGDTADFITVSGLSSAPWMTYADNIGVILIENGVKTIGRNFFAQKAGTINSVPKSLVLINSVVKISERAFYNANPESANLNSLPNLVQIDSFAFAGNLFTTLTLPDNLSVIGEGAFADCTSLTKVTIPESVTIIDDYAFSGCSALNTVYYKGTREQFNKIYIGNANSALTNATVVCADDIRIKNTSLKKGDKLEVTLNGDLAYMTVLQRTITWQRSTNEAGDFYNLSGNFSGTIGLTIKEPKAGEAFSESSAIAAATSDNADVEVTGVSFRANNTMIKEGELFEEYTTYEIYLTLETINDAFFGPDLDTVSFKINNKNATGLFANVGKANAYGVTFKTGKSINRLSTVNVNFTEPTAGLKPNYTVSKDEEKCRFYQLSEHGTGLEFADKATGKTMQADEPFVSGKTYTATVYLTTEAEGLVSTFEPDIKVNFNSKAAAVNRVNEKWLIVTCDFVASSFSGSYIMGDVDNSGAVDNTDAVLLKRYAMNWVGSADKIKNMAAGDLNGDN